MRQYFSSHSDSTLVRKPSRDSVPSRSTTRRAAAVRIINRLKLGTAILALIPISLWADSDVPTDAPAPPVPANLSCEADCPNLGVDRHEGRLTPSKVGNRCGSRAYRINVGGLAISGNSDLSFCPSFAIYTAPCGYTTAREGCCIAAASRAYNLRISFRCECTERLLFVFCRREQCVSDNCSIISTEPFCATAANCPNSESTNCNSSTQ